MVQWGFEPQSLVPLVLPLYRTEGVRLATRPQNLGCYLTILRHTTTCWRGVVSDARIRHGYHFSRDILPYFGNCRSSEITDGI
jgi:hypothetical protein